MLAVTPSYPWYSATQGSLGKDAKTSLRGDEGEMERMNQNSQEEEVVLTLLDDCIDSLCGQ